jgi:hypothetical protein
MSDTDARAELAELLRAHDLETEPTEDGWLIPTNSRVTHPPLITAQWHPRNYGGQLDVHVGDDSFHLIESCASFGDGEKAILDGFANFANNSLHVILADCYDIIDPEQVLQEIWHVNGKSYLATIGNISARSTGEASPLPDEFYERLEQAILQADLDQPRHWFRFFAAHLPDQQMVFEALLNNEPWEPGEQVLQNLEWEQTDYYYSLRLFLMLQAYSES